MAAETGRGARADRMAGRGLMTASPETLEELEEIVTDVGKSPGCGVCRHVLPERRSHRMLYKTRS
jgi:hypothetical protein